MQSGLGHQQEEDPPSDGSMALFCLACPQPGINLPEDWKDRYNPWVFIEHVSHLIVDSIKATNSSEPLLWMETSQQSI
jgi:hypothetical protein